MTPTSCDGILSSIEMKSEKVVELMLMPYIKFTGNCEEAFLRYAQIFNGEIQQISKYGDIPETPDMPMDEELKSKVMHAQLMLPGLGGISGADYTEPVAKSGNVLIQAHLSNQTSAQQIFSALAAGGNILGPLATNPPPDDNSISGCLEDSFGVTWIISAGTN